MPDAAATDDPTPGEVIDLTAESEPAGAQPPSDPDPGPGAAEVADEADVPAALASAPAPPVVAANGATAKRPKARSAPQAEPEPVVPLEPRQVWLDQQNDLWLTECEYTNVRRGGRKVISRSAVVRLALDELRKAMTPEQITDLLADRELTQPGRGRPRR